MISKKPKLVIGVSGASERTKSVRAMMKQIGEEGAQPVFLSPGKFPKRSALEHLAQIEALVLMGNNYDIDPGCYLHRYPEDSPKRQLHPQTHSEYNTLKSKARAHYETEMLTRALSLGMPVLGICGGMQRINVHCGGTLHQHLPDLVGCDKHMQNKQGIALHVPVMPIIIKEGTMLGNIAGGIRNAFIKSQQQCPTVIMENSLHHQAMDRIGHGLQVSAVTDSVRMKNGTNGYLPEAIEPDPEGKFAKQFILGVQWHPEFGASSLGQHIVQHVIVAARKFAREHCSPVVRKKMVFGHVKSVKTSTVIPA